MAKKACLTEHSAQKFHYRRLIISRIKDEDARAIFSNDKANEFMKKNGGYSRIYKLVPLVGDAAKMHIIELVLRDDIGYSKSKNHSISKAKDCSSIKSHKRKRRTSYYR
jgi:large subunit ribosomal protein L17